MYVYVCVGVFFFVLYLALHVVTYSAYTPYAHRCHTLLHGLPHHPNPNGQLGPPASL